MVFNSENEMGVPTKSDETAEDSKSTSSSGIVTDCSSNNDDDDNSRSSSSADDDYVWTMSEELREFATMELGETDEVRRRDSLGCFRDPVNKSTGYSIRSLTLIGLTLILAVPLSALFCLG